MTPGILYITATPIGNLEDITLRALRILKEVGVIAAEDTRHTRKLLSYYNINTPLISYYREKEEERSIQLVARLLAGESIALVSDAGTPGISDPGATLVNRARDAGVTVVPIPGPSALITALSVSGCSDSSFFFAGFAPAKKSQRKSLITSLKAQPHPIIFYESPRRIQPLLTDILNIMGDRETFWARELSKTHEDLQHGRTSELLKLASTNKNRGEFVLIVYPGESKQAEGENVEELLVWYKNNTELSVKDVSKTIAEDLGISRSSVYQQALIIYKKKT